MLRKRGLLVRASVDAMTTHVSMAVAHNQQEYMVKMAWVMESKCWRIQQSRTMLVSFGIEPGCATLAQVENSSSAVAGWAAYEGPGIEYIVPPMSSSRPCKEIEE